MTWLSFCAFGICACKSLAYINMLVKLTPDSIIKTQESSEYTLLFLTSLKQHYCIVLFLNKFVWLQQKNRLELIWQLKWNN